MILYIVGMYKIDLELLGKTFMPDYRNESSDTYKTLVMELEPMVVSYILQIVRNDIKHLIMVS
jgi:hypothetical protein